MEIKVVQGSEKWFELRNSLTLTASKFGDALGVGQGRPYDFMMSLLMNDDPLYEDIGATANTQHGIDLEPIIDEAYQILTGHVTEKSGLWLPDERNLLYNVCGASPDRKVHDSLDRSRMIGLVEYKAPVYRMYCTQKHPPHGIPRQYMAQIQAQMAFSNQKWCDFMAICKATKEIHLCKVYFHSLYWSHIAAIINDFCGVLKEARSRKANGVEPLDFHDARKLKSRSLQYNFFPGESNIVVKNLLQRDISGRYKTERGTFTFDFLIGNL